MSDHIVYRIGDLPDGAASIGLEQSFRQTKEVIAAGDTLRRARKEMLAKRQTRNPELLYAQDLATARSMARSVARRAMGRWDGTSKGG